MTSKEKIRNLDLSNAILKLKNRNEALMFLRDLLTESELIEFGNRFKAAQMLKEEIPYSKIEKETSLSSATVARVSKWLKKGKGGYKLILDRLAKENHHHISTSFKRGLC